MEPITVTALQLQQELNYVLSRLAWLGWEAGDAGWVAFELACRWAAAYQLLTLRFCPFDDPPKMYFGTCAGERFLPAP